MLKNILSWVLLSAVMYLLKSVNFLVFHMAVELVTVLILFSLFIFYVNTKKYNKTPFIAVFSLGAFIFGYVTLIHAMAYKGMNLFPAYDADLPTQLWIIQRFFEGLTFLLASVMKKDRSRIYFIAAFAVSVVMVLSAFLGYFPRCYIEGEGLTFFKVFIEYLVIAVLAVALFFTSRTLEFSAELMRKLQLALIFSILSGFAFTLYSDVYGIMNFTGHILRIISYYLVYLSLLRTNLTLPLDTLFRDLNEKNIQTQRENLALSGVNENLKDLKVDLERKLDDLLDKRSRYVEQISELTLTKSDVLIHNQELIKENMDLKAMNDEYQEELRNYFMLLSEAEERLKELMESREEESSAADF